MCAVCRERLCFLKRFCRKGIETSSLSNLMNASWLANRWTIDVLIAVVKFLYKTKWPLLWSHNTSCSIDLLFHHGAEYEIDFNQPNWIELYSFGERRSKEKTIALGVQRALEWKSFCKVAQFKQSPKNRRLTLFSGTHVWLFSTCFQPCAGPWGPTIGERWKGATTCGRFVWTP